jgi:hypothetical protein
MTTSGQTCLFSRDSLRLAGIIDRNAAAIVIQAMPIICSLSLFNAHLKIIDTGSTAKR